MRTLKMYHALKPNYDIRIIFSWKISKQYLDGIDYIWLNRWEISTWEVDIIRNKYFQDFLPDIFFLDFFPFWRLHSKSDIDFLIDLCKDNNGKVITYSRDIFDGKKIKTELKDEQVIKTLYGQKDFQEVIKYSYSSDNMKFLSKIVLEDYIDKKKIDCIYVFWSQNIHDFWREFVSEDKYLKKFFYLWYLLDEEKWSLTDITKSKNIIVSSWWGFHNKKWFLKLLKILSGYKDFHINFFAWDDLLSDDLHSLNKYIDSLPNVTLHRFGNNYFDILQHSDLAFIAGWYNSVCDMIQFQIPCFIIGYGDSKSIQTNHFEISQRISSFKDVNGLEGLYDFDIKKIYTILNNLYTKSRNNLYKNINICSYQDINDFLKSTVNEEK